MSARATLRASENRWLSPLVGAVFVCGLVLLVARVTLRAAPRADGAFSATELSRATGASDATSQPPAARLATAVAELEATPLADSNVTSKLFDALEGVRPSNVGRKLPDGRDPPPLPSTAPRRVRFGVVLVRYAGAQLAPEGAPARDVASARARALAEQGRHDFAAAVRAGDPGSAPDIGVVRRGILEPATEYALFTLPVGWVSEPLDTPRGFWIVKRLR